MENATKALLIAGAVLIAIVLIAVGLKILSSTSGITDEVEGLSTTMETSMFNTQYSQYEGVQKGTVVKELLAKIITLNNKNPDRRITVQTDNNVDWGNSKYTNGTYVVENITNIRSKVTVTKNYQIDITGYNADGYINKIKITVK